MLLTPEMTAQISNWIDAKTEFSRSAIDQKKASCESE
jgi:hypothetical protein